MAIIELKIPNLGESISSVTFSRWLKPNGSIVALDEPLCEIETEKANQEISADKPGKLLINCYFFENKSTNIFAIPSNYIFEFKTEKISARVDLSTGDIQFDLMSNNQAEIESFLTIIFSIATIHVLLQPKFDITSPIQTNKTLLSPIKRGGLTVSTTDLAAKPNPIDPSHFLLNLIGYNELIASAIFNEYWEHKPSDYEFKEFEQCETKWISGNKFDVIYKFS